MKLKHDIIACLKFICKFKRSILATTLAVMVLLLSLWCVNAEGTPMKVVIANSLDSYNVGGDAPFTTISDLGWRSGTTVAKATVQNGSDAIGFSKSVVLNSGTEEGQGPVNGTPLYGMNIEVPVNSDTNAVMLYIKSPQIGTESSDPWPPYDWAIRLDSLRVHQASTAANDLWGKYIDSTIKYLDINSDGWKEAKSDLNGSFLIPGGFEGYIKLYLNNVDNYSNWASSGFDASKDYTLDYMQWVFAWLGGKYGSFDIGGFYSVVEDSDSVMLITDKSKTPVMMVKDTTPLEAQLVHDVSDKETGSAVDSSFISISDNGWRPGTTKAVAKIGEAIVPNSDNKSVQIFTADKEGEGPNNATPCITVNPDVTVKSNIGAFMMYVETPVFDVQSTVQWALRVSSLSYAQAGKQDWFFSNFDEAEYYTLAYDDNEWQKNVTDANGTLYLSNGFKGYIKFYVNTAKTFNGDYNQSADFEVKSINFVFGWLGGDCGNFAIGGIYALTHDSSSTQIILDGAPERSMIKFVDRIEATTKYDISSKNVGDTVSSDLVSISDMGWRPGTTNAKATVGDNICRVTDNKSIVVNTESAEGEGPNNATPNVSLKSWIPIKSDTNAFMIYMELPRYVEPSAQEWSIRISSLSVQQAGIGDWLFSGFSNGTYSYLSVDGNKWVSNSADANGTIKLKNGFKGYVKFYLNTCNNYSDWIENKGFKADTDYQLNNIDFIFGWLGGEYGPFKIGEIFGVTRDSNSTIIKVNGGELSDMTNYTEKNENLVKEFVETVESIKAADITDAIAVDKAKLIYASIADEFKEKISSETMKKLNSAESVTANYRPKIKGVTVKVKGEQALKFGAYINTNASADAGYSVSGCGAVYIKKSNFDDSGLLLPETTGAKSVVGSIENKSSGVLDYSVVIPVDVTEYEDVFVIRTYVTYTNNSTGDTVSVWNADYEFQDGRKSNAFESSLIEAALYFGIPVLGAD